MSGVRLLMEKGSQKPILPTPEPMRNFSVRGISALIAPIIRPAFRRRAPAAYQLLADWEILAGPELAAIARPVKLAGGTLSLVCTGPTAMELQYRSAQLIQRLNLGLGGSAIERLRFIQDTITTAPAPAIKSAKIVRAEPENLPEGPLGEALAKLYQGIVGRQE